MSTSPGPRIRALRGATTATDDRPEAIVTATKELLGSLLAANDVAPDDVVSVIFTATPDLSSEFPAAAAHELDIGDVALLCATEIDVPGAVARCIRVLVHVYTTRGHSALRHVYLEGASHLREQRAPNPREEV